MRKASCCEWQKRSWWLMSSSSKSDDNEQRKTGEKAEIFCTIRWRRNPCCSVHEQCNSSSSRQEGNLLWLHTLLASTSPPQKAAKVIHSIVLPEVCLLFATRCDDLKCCRGSFIPSHRPTPHSCKCTELHKGRGEQQAKKLIRDTKAK